MYKSLNKNTDSRKYKLNIRSGMHVGVQVEMHENMRATGRGSIAPARKLYCKSFVDFVINEVITPVGIECQAGAANICFKRKTPDSTGGDFNIMHSVGFILPPLALQTVQQSLFKFEHGIPARRRGLHTP